MKLSTYFLIPITPFMKIINYIQEKGKSIKLAENSLFMVFTGMVITILSVQLINSLTMWNSEEEKKTILFHNEVGHMQFALNGIR